MTEHKRWLKEQEEDEEICKLCEMDDCSMCEIRNRSGEQE